MGAISARAGGGTASLYTKDGVVQSYFGVFDIWAHEILRIMCICYVTLGHYHIR